MYDCVWGFGNNYRCVSKKLLTPSVPRRVSIFILVTIWWFYTASKTRVGDLNSENCGHSSSDLHRPFLMPIKWSNGTQISR
ncbi:hypothetical protein E2C01_025893 [Portunus trituberculatus]|uniref:Uncharacterized protein n=1 Tax=Portunus trituberculatus TaxID=210409 RepID=A0A5B7EGN9_PORTR|nr:hypothetical protein [Portunus trituberculatus]